MHESVPLDMAAGQRLRWFVPLLGSVMLAKAQSFIQVVGKDCGQILQKYRLIQVFIVCLYLKV